MSKSMLIDASQEEQSRVAIVEDGILESLEIENLSRTLKGNIYKGVVQNLATALGAAFVHYGDERAGFLPLDEVNFKVLPPRNGDGGRRGRINDHMQSGMEVLVQVVRDAFSTKPPTLSTFYSLPGRYLVLTPKSDGSGISRKIEDSAERDHLKQIVEELCPPEGFGVIVRTAGMGQTKTELQRDLRYLLKLWESIEQAAKAHRAPSLIYQERDVVLRTIRDHFSPDIEEVLIDSPEVYQKATRFVQAVMPAKEKAFKLYSGDKPLFSKFNLEDQIESIFRREVSLKSGGAIVIDVTEALTSVDVNSARSARESNIEELAFRTNLEAAEEVARQLRLRDLGGLVVIDFIDMYQAKNNRAVEKKMRESMKKDRAKYDIGRISKFGLLEISRQRIKATKASATYLPCARCEGTGVVKTVEAAALIALRRVQARVVKGDLESLRATLPEEAAVYLLNHKRDELVALERRYGTEIAIIPHPTMNPARGEFDPVVREGPRETPREVPAAQRPLVSDEEAARTMASLVEEVAAAEPTDMSAEDAGAVPPAADAPEPALDEDAEIRSMVTMGEAGEAASEPATAQEGAESENGDAPGGRRRRRRRRGRGGRGNGLVAGASAAASMVADADPRTSGEDGHDEGSNGDSEPVAGGAEAAEGEGQGPRRRRRRRRRSRRGGASQGVGTGAPGAEDHSITVHDAGDSYAPAMPAASHDAPAQPANPPEPVRREETADDLEEIPGGWWQKMMGGNPGRGR